MKRTTVIKFTTVAIMLLVTVCGIYAQGGKKNKNNVKDVTFNVNMVCKNCQNKIERNIPWEKGVKDVKVDLENKQVKVTYDDRKTSVEKLIKAFEALEYECTVAEPEPDKKDTESNKK